MDLHLTLKHCLTIEYNLQRSLGGFLLLQHVGLGFGPPKANVGIRFSRRPSFLVSTPISWCILSKLLSKPPVTAI